MYYSSLHLLQADEVSVNAQSETQKEVEANVGFVVPEEVEDEALACDESRQDSNLLAQCGRLAERSIAQGSGATLPLAFVQGYAAKSSGAMRAALAAVFSDSIVILHNASISASDVRTGLSSHSRPRLILASEARAYSSTGWRVVLSPAWPAPPLSAELLRRAAGDASNGWLQLSAGSFGSRFDNHVAGDTMRVVIQNLGLLVGEAEGVHEDSGRWAENSVAWMVDSWARRKVA